MSKEEEFDYAKAIEKASGSITRFPLIPVRGIPLMCHIANNWDSIWAFSPDPSDLLIATYPKAGTDRNVYCVIYYYYFYLSSNVQLEPEIKDSLIISH